MFNIDDHLLPVNQLTYWTFQRGVFEHSTSSLIFLTLIPNLNNKYRILHTAYVKKICRSVIPYFLESWLYWNWPLGTELVFLRPSQQQLKLWHIHDHTFQYSILYFVKKVQFSPPIPVELQQERLLIELFTFKNILNPNIYHHPGWETRL